MKMKKEIKREGKIFRYGLFIVFLFVGMFFLGRSIGYVVYQVKAASISEIGRAHV